MFWPWYVWYFCFSYIGLFIHEIGHGVAGRCNGFEVTSLGTGIARPLLVWNWGTTRVYICRRKPFQGLTFVVSPQLYPPRRARVWMLAGGVLANSLVAVCALALWFLTAKEQVGWLGFAGVNGLMAATNLWPFTLRIGNAVLRSDGAQIFALLQRRTPEANPNVTLRNVAALCPLMEAVGDTSSLYHYLTSAVAAHLELGEIEAARDVYAEALALPVQEKPWRHAYSALLRSLIALEAREMTEANAALDAAESEFRAIDHTNGLFMTQWVRAEIQIHHKDIPAALESLNALAVHPLLQDPRMKVSLLVTRFRALEAQHDGEGARCLLEEYEATRARYPSPVRDRAVYGLLAQLTAQEEKWAVAEPFYRKVLGALQQLYVSFPDEDETRRKAFGDRFSEHLTGFQTCLRQQGKQDEADKLDTFFATLEEAIQTRVQAQHQKEQAEKQHLRQQDRLSFGCLLANSLVALFGWLIVTFSAQSNTGWVWYMKGWGLFSALGAVLGLVLIAAGRQTLELRRSGGYIALGITGLLWLMMLLLAFAA